MFTIYNSKFKDDIINIFVGEYYVTNKNEIISTLLGSCVSVCLIDDVNNVYGMNHFLLPGNITSKEIYTDNSARLGVYSMELLINRMLKVGADKRNLKAKVFGGGKVLRTNTNIISVNLDNIRFAKEFLQYEGIPIIAEDTNGKYGRKIYFDTRDGSVFVEKVGIGMAQKQEDNTIKTDKKQDNLELWE